MAWLRKIYPYALDTYFTSKPELVDTKACFRAHAIGWGRSDDFLEKGVTATGDIHNINNIII